MTDSIGTMNFQRVGSVSNAHVGDDFETLAAQVLEAAGFRLQRNLAVQIGHGGRKKSHRFDLGSLDPPMIVECKSHTWTSGGNMPSAKLTTWNEAMYYFALAPSTFRKIFFVLKDVRRGESLGEYYVRLHAHMIPDGVEVWERCALTGDVAVIFQLPPHAAR